jgi:hypothetical protein
MVLTKMEFFNSHAWFRKLSRLLSHLGFCVADYFRVARDLRAIANGQVGHVKSQTDNGGCVAEP